MRRNAVFCYLTSIEKFVRFLLSGLLKYILAQQDMELAERSTDLKRKKRFGEIIKELVCVLVAGVLMAMEGSLQVILSRVPPNFTNVGHSHFITPCAVESSMIQQSVRWD